MPSWCFPPKQSAHLCLGPALSGVAQSHHPKPSTPWDSEQTVSLLSPASLQSPHWRTVTCEVHHFFLLPHRFSLASPNGIRTSPSISTAPALEAFQGTDGDTAGTWEGCWLDELMLELFGAGGEGRKGCGSWRQSRSLSADGSSHSAGSRRTWTSPPLTCCNQMLEVSCAGRWVVGLLFIVESEQGFYFFN